MQSPAAVNHPDGGAMSDPRWYVVQTEPRCESFVARELADGGFTAYLPMCLAKRRETPARQMSRARRGSAPIYVTVHVPMFPGYLFVTFDIVADPWRRIRRTMGVKRLFQHREDAPTPVGRGAVEALQAGAEDRLTLRSAAPLYEAGAVLRVQDGPFADHAGVCLWNDETRVRVLLEIFGRSTEVELLRRSVTPAA